MTYQEMLGHAKQTLANRINTKFLSFIWFFLTSAVAIILTLETNIYWLLCWTPFLIIFIFFLVIFAQYPYRTSPKSKSPEDVFLWFWTIEMKYLQKEEMRTIQNTLMSAQTEREDEQRRVTLYTQLRDDIAKLPFSAGKNVMLGDMERILKNSQGRFDQFDAQVAAAVQATEACLNKYAQWQFLVKDSRPHVGCIANAPSEVNSAEMQDEVMAKLKPMLDLWDSRRIKPPHKTTPYIPPTPGSHSPSHAPPVPESFS